MSRLRRLQNWQPDVLVLITIANLGMFAVSMYLSSRLAPHALPTSSTAPSGETLYILGSNVPHLVFRGQVFRLVTGVFLHADLIHLIMNTIGLLNLGRHVQAVLGPRRFWTVYAVTGIFASIVSLLWYASKSSTMFGGGSISMVDMAGSVGASGAICGLLGFLLGFVRRATDAASVMIRRQLIFWSILMLAIGLMPGVPIDNAAHIGGGVAGFALAVVLDRRRGILRRVIESRALSLALVAVVALALGWGGLAWAGGWGANARSLLPAREALYVIGNLEYGRDGARSLATAYLREIDSSPATWHDTETADALIDYIRLLAAGNPVDPRAYDRAARAVSAMKETLGPYRR